MVTLTQANAIRWTTRLRPVLWLAAVGVLVAPLVLLSIAIKNNPMPSQDPTILAWVAGWDFPVLGDFLEGMSVLTEGWVLIPLGLSTMVFLLLLGMKREAWTFAIASGVVGLIAAVIDYSLGEIVVRARPLPGAPNLSFPSGHVWGATAFFGFCAFLLAHYGLKRRLLVPLVSILLLLILSTGASRIYVQDHWPSDVAAGYLFGALLLLFMIPLFLRLRRMTWVFSPKLDEDISALSCETCRIVHSIASVVLLDAEKGTATKVYRPPPVVSLLYWVAFQARFPYQRNTVALLAASYRRKIASLLTMYQFGKDLVAHVTAVNCSHGNCSFITEYVPGEKAKNDEQTKHFLAQVSDTFAEAGLSIWQVNPRNPHAHTNLIRTPQGDLKIIDLESAVVTVLPAPGQWRSALKSGSFPVFDDIDFPRLRGYITTNESALEGSLGPEGLAELKVALDLCESAIRSWKDAEPRIWGHIVSRIYRLLDWKAFLQHLMGALGGADRAAEAFLSRGIDRWEREGRLEPSAAAALRSHLSSDEVKDALHHLGAHLVLSAIFRFPFGSAVRFAWTAAFWLITQSGHFRHRAGASAGKLPNIHTPLVMALSLIPGLGAIAYLVARPLRKKLLVRLMVDQVAYKLPFRLYHRLHLSRRLAPSKLHIPTSVEEVETHSRKGHPHEAH